MTTDNEDELIAVVAMECRLPKAAGVDEFWRMLVAGESGITDLTAAELAAAGVSEAGRARPDQVNRAGVLDGVAEFDAGYFGYSEREADILDPQQRLMLQGTVALLERANLDPHRTDLRIGVYAGSGMSTYVSGVLSRADLVDSLGEMLVRHGNDKDFLATRISYKLNLRGPSVNVQTACSTGLVAVHSAVQGLLLNECDAAVAGAVYVRVPQQAGYRFQVGGVLSPDGVCRPFDAGANGTLFTNGLGLVLLKRLRDAIADGDEVHAVIAGSAVNNDGSEKVSFTAPSVSGQVAVLSEALRIAGAKQTDVTYIEAHGTGTALGDPVEIEAIKQAYGLDGEPCGIGSLKGNFGHLNIAAGIVGLIKAVLVLKHRFVPPTIGVRTVNPALELDGSRYFVTTEGRALDEGTTWAAVSAFGMGGTNGHVVLRSYDRAAEPVAAGPDGRAAVLTLSARSAEALRRQATSLAGHLAATGGPLDAYAYTLRAGRSRHPFRAALAGVDPAEVATRLRAGRYHVGSEPDPAGIAFVFGGQGTQRAGMGAALAARDEPFRRRLAEVLDLLGEQPAEPDTTDTAVAQPLLFAVEYALATTLIDAGVRPGHLFGHSLGEVVAAAVAGVFDLRSAAAIVSERARLMAACPPGAMLSVDRLEPFGELIGRGSLVVAGRNSPRQFVLSGTHAAVDDAVAVAGAAGVHHQRLLTSHAFHSPLMREASERFLAFLQPFVLEAPRIPLVSNITGRVLTEFEARNPHYWAEHLIRPVEFAASVRTLRELGVTRFVEIGSGRAMGNLVRAGFGDDPVQVAHALGDPEREEESFADALALGWAADGDVPVEAYASAPRMIPLPTYPFEKRTHWIEPVAAPQVVPTPAPGPAPVVVEKVEEAPLDDVTAEIRTVVGQVFQSFLGGDRVAADKEFFALGGNSLMAIQLINKLRETFGLDLSVRDFYENSSVDGITRVVTALLLEEPAHV